MGNVRFIVIDVRSLGYAATGRREAADGVWPTQLVVASFMLDRQIQPGNPQHTCRIVVPHLVASLARVMVESALRPIQPVGSV